ncbi:MAG: hypothetical protein ALECFALPRED_005547 [Alectoria fallacina]|uniref:Uncharacterized protein n=1 Tax=Alectoria fallacina TaxID=1903189 RepID=A0A8H3G525_9LECA|nr:MAG: hypothetical protein ALECFALPRED_005547 [Alectoria fallacina]
MSSNPLAPNSGFTTTNGNEKLSAAALKNVPTHNKIKAYVNTKSKDDPWSPYTIQNDTSSALSKEYKGR